VTLALIVVLIGSVVFADVNVGLAAFAGAVLLTLLRPANERLAMSLIPWKVILMVSGVSILVAMLEKTGGLDLSTALLAQIATPASATAVAAFFSGVISIFSSTSGVVLPALIPMVPGFVERLGGGSALAVASAINVNGHLVDVSPLSTLGALCLASAPSTTDPRRLFNQLMAWGASMAIIGALVCWLVFGVLGLA
jgi:di/tricarboxylate transporter